MDKTINDFINLWVGKRLEGLNCICEMLDFCFSDNLVLHGLGLTRIFLNDDLIITTMITILGIKKRANIMMNGSIQIIFGIR